MFIFVIVDNGFIYLFFKVSFSILHKLLQHDTSTDLDSWRTYMQACFLWNVMQFWIEQTIVKEKNKQKWQSSAVGYAYSLYLFVLFGLLCWYATIIFYNNYIVLSKVLTHFFHSCVNMILFTFVISINQRVVPFLFLKSTLPWVKITYFLLNTENRQYLCNILSLPCMIQLFKLILLIVSLFSNINVVPLLFQSNG